MLYIVCHKVYNGDAVGERKSRAVETLWIKEHILGTDHIVSRRWNDHSVVSLGWEGRSNIIDCSRVIDHLPAIHQFEIGHQVIFNWNLSHSVGK